MLGKTVTELMNIKDEFGIKFNVKKVEKTKLIK